jgi:hypothetical protein
METTEFPNCCGIMTLNDFGYTNVTGGNYGATTGIRPWGAHEPPTKEQIKAFVSTSLNDFKDYAILAVALNKEQADAIGPIFEELGFKMVSQGLNSHHKSEVFLYTFCNTEYYSYDDWNDDYEEEMYEEEEV